MLNFAHFYNQRYSLFFFKISVGDSYSNINSNWIQRDHTLCSEYMRGSKKKKGKKVKAAV